MADYTLLHGDCLGEMRKLAPNSVDAIVTDPPYALVSITKRFGKEGSAPPKSDGATGVYARASKGFMGKTWDTGERAFAPELWAEALRVLKPGGHVLAFGGTRTYHRLVCAIEDAGFEIRDQIAWVYGSGFPKSHNQGNGWGTALKPAIEPICLARKPLSEPTVAANVLKWGTGAINVDGCRVEGASWTFTHSDKTSRSSGIMGKTSAARSGVAESSPLGRWPANLIHDGSDEVIAAFPSPHGAGSQTEGKWNAEGWFGKGQGARFGDSGSAARFFYCPKASKKDRDAGLEGMPEVAKAATWGDLGPVEGNPRKVATGHVQRQRNTHPTVKPTALMAYLCRLVTPPGGTVLDPFMGSGSTGRGALQEGFSFIGIEREAEYLAIAERRIADAPLGLGFAA